MDKGIRRSLQDLAQYKKTKSAEASEKGKGRVARLLTQDADRAVQELLDDK